MNQNHEEEVVNSRGGRVHRHQPTGLIEMDLFGNSHVDTVSALSEAETFASLTRDELELEERERLRRSASPSPSVTAFAHSGGIFTMTQATFRQIVAHPTTAIAGAPWTGMLNCYHHFATQVMDKLRKSEVISSKKELEWFQDLLPEKEKSILAKFILDISRISREEVGRGSVVVDVGLFSEKSAKKVLTALLRESQIVPKMIACIQGLRDRLDTPPPSLSGGRRPHRAPFPSRSPLATPSSSSRSSTPNLDRLEDMVSHLVNNSAETHYRLRRTEDALERTLDEVQRAQIASQALAVASMAQQRAQNVQLMGAINRGFSNIQHQVAAQIQALEARVMSRLDELTAVVGWTNYDEVGMPAESLPTYANAIATEQPRAPSSGPQRTQSAARRNQLHRSGTPYGRELPSYEIGSNVGASTSAASFEDVEMA